MIVFIPISVFRVPYEVAAGRPYSYLERLVLEAVSQDTREMEGLCDIFGVHRRIVIEVLVTLMYAGWIALEARAEGTGNQYCITQAGIRAIESSKGAQKVLPAATAIRKASISVVMERTLGQIARNSEVIWHPRANLSHLWEKGFVLT